MATYATQLTRHHSLNNATTPLLKYVQVTVCICGLASVGKVAFRNELVAVKKGNSLHLLAYIVTYYANSTSLPV